MPSHEIRRSVMPSHEISRPATLLTLFERAGGVQPPGEADGELLGDPRFL